MRSVRILAIVLVSGLFLCPGCHKPAPPLEMAPTPDYSAPLPPGQLALRKITDPALIPDFSSAHLFRIQLAEATDRSLSYMAKPSSQGFFPYGDITHEHAVASIKAFREVLDQAKDGEELNRLIRERFDVYESVGYNGQGIVWFTGYYTPIFDGRQAPDGQFKYPLYSLPDDLIKDANGNCLGRKLPGGGTTSTYYTRREIETNKPLAGKEIAWLRDPFEAYIVTVQGSAKLRLADGSFFEIGYVANNGFEYTPIAPKLIEDGKIPANELSLKRMIDFFRMFPNEIEYYTQQNDRYVFFMPRAGGPFGSLNEMVTPYRTIATDKQVYPRACVAFMTNIVPGYERGTLVEKRYEAFALDQDTGGAIRAPGRCDIFMGVGDKSGELAGRTAAEGRLYYIFTK
jgi:membrane-bound lytic murein transglycosylase A